MDANIKSEILEIIEIVKQCPESLQLRAFEILLQHTLESSAPEKSERNGRDERRKDSEPGDARPEDSRKNDSALNVNGLPMRVKAFMKKNSISSEEIEKLFHIEGGQIEPIWELKTNRYAEGQIHIALMQSLKRALTSGEFSFNQEEVRNEARDKRTYQDNNFAANFKNRQGYFTKLAKEGLNPLSDEGMNALATLIKQLTTSGK